MSAKNKTAVLDPTDDPVLDMERAEVIKPPARELSIEEAVAIENREAVEKKRERLVELIAHICHEANRVYSESLGDCSHEFWEDCDEEIRQPEIAGVEFILRQRHIRTSPADSHSEWIAGKVADGWQHGETKDAEKKTHPCLVPWKQLDPGQRLKDYLFVGIVRAFMDAADEQK